MKFTQNFTFLECLFISVQRMHNFAWVPVNYFQLRKLFRLVNLFVTLFLILVIFLQFVKHFLGGYNILHKLLILNLGTKSLVIRTVRIDSKNNRQFLFHGKPKLIEVFFRYLELPLIILLKEWMVGWDGLAFPLSLSFYSFGTILAFIIFAILS